MNLEKEKATQIRVNEENNQQNYIDQETVRYAYDKLLQTRDLDNTLMWTRINLLLVFQGVLLGAIATAVDKLLVEKYIPLYLTLIVFGLLSSILLNRIAKGGSWWVTHWEEILAKIEDDAIGDVNIFRVHTSNNKELKKTWKREGYISVRDSIVTLTTIFPVLWIIILSLLVWWVLPKIGEILILS